MGALHARVLQLRKVDVRQGDGEREAGLAAARIQMRFAVCRLFKHAIIVLIVVPFMRIQMLSRTVHARAYGR